MPDLKIPEKFVQSVALWDRLSEQTIDFGDGKQLWSGSLYLVFRELGYPVTSQMMEPLRRMLEQMGAATVVHCSVGRGSTVLELHHRPTWDAWIAAGGELPKRRPNRTPQSELHEKALARYVKRDGRAREHVIASILAMDETARRETWPFLPCGGFLTGGIHVCRVQGLDATVPRAKWQQDSTAPTTISEPRDDGQVAVTVHRSAGPVSFTMPADLLDQAPPATTNREGTGEHGNTNEMRARGYWRNSKSGGWVAPKYGRSPDGRALRADGTPMNKPQRRVKT